MRSAIKVAAVGACLLATVELSACTIFNPYDGWDGQFEAQPNSLDEAIAYTNRALLHYQSAIGDQAILTNATNLTLVAAVGAALGLAATGGSTEVLTGLGLGGSAAYAAGSLLTNSNRQLIYIAGMEALICAKKAVQPLNDARFYRPVTHSPAGDSYGHSQFELNSLIPLRTQLATAEALFANFLEELSLAEHQTGIDDILANAHNLKDRASSAIGLARSSLNQGETLQATADGAASALVAKTDEIAIKVDKAVAGTVADLQSLPSLIGQLSQMSSQFGRLPGIASNAEKSVGQAFAAGAAPKLEAAISKLEGAVILLEGRSGDVSSVVGSVANASAVPSRLEGCTTEDVSTALSVQPYNKITFTKGTAAEIWLTISGGQKPYDVVLVEGGAGGLTISRGDQFDGSVLVRYDGVGGGGPYSLKIAEASVKHQMVFTTIEISGQAAQTGASAASPPQTCSDEATRYTLTPAIVKKIIEKLGLDPSQVTEIGDSKVRAALKGKYPDGKGCLTDTAYQELTN